mmetsp:Transcript_9638/g.9304  ORF Transcript_9638/g.9304 Transcript_9638/m.9304 type:complete len:233 (+) Transcript_9638:3628-4326(+)
MLDDLDDNEKELRRKRKEYDEKRAAQVRMNISDKSRAIIKFWIIRARIKQKVTIQVNRIIEGKIQPNCLYCGASFGLRVELIQNIENLFYSFLQEGNYTLADYDALQWQAYFSEFGSFRTLCLDCIEYIDRYNARVKRELRKQEARTMKLKEKDELVTEYLQTVATNKNAIIVNRKQSRLGKPSKKDDDDIVSEEEGQDSSQDSQDLIKKKGQEDNKMGHQTFEEESKHLSH